METIEFLQRTGRKNIRNYIEIKVKEKLKEYEVVLQQRQQMLRDILEFEYSQYNEELVLLMRERLKEQRKKRLDWIHASSMERIKAEKELLKLKNQQRELENCEKWRHLQSKQLLLDSKKAQIYQIEDKKLRNQREKEIDKMWNEVMDNLNREKEYQEIYEAEFLKIIEGANLLKNQEISDRNKKQQELEYEQAKMEFQEENQKALYLEEKHRQDEKRSEYLNKMRNQQMLKSQISSNLEKKTLETQMLLNEDRLQKDIEDQKILSEREHTEKEKIRNNEWHKRYLENCLKEKQQRLKEENEFGRMYLNTGCVLRQTPKRPYGRNTR